MKKTKNKSKKMERKRKREFFCLFEVEPNHRLIFLVRRKGKRFLLSFRVNIYMDFQTTAKKERFFGLMFHFLLTCLICSTVRSSPFLSNCSLTRDSKLRMILPTGCFNFLSTKVLESGYNRDIWMVSSRGPINKRHKGQIKT